MWLQLDFNFEPVILENNKSEPEPFRKILVPILENDKSESECFSNILVPILESAILIWTVGLNVYIYKTFRVYMYSESEENLLLIVTIKHSGLYNL